MSRTDVDRPSTWRLYSQGLCEKCWGGCCTLPVEVGVSDLIRLGLVSEKESLGSINRLAKRLIREGLIGNYHPETKSFILAQKQGRDCCFLDSKTRLCTVYDKRPDVCREFPEIGPRPGYCPSSPKGTFSG